MTYPAALCVLLVFFTGLAVGIFAVRLWWNAVRLSDFHSQVTLLRGVYKDEKLQKAYKSVLFDDMMFCGKANEPTCPICNRSLVTGHIGDTAIVDLTRMT